MFGARKMAKSIFVGNLPFRCTEGEIEALFARYGAVGSVKLINDRETGKPRGFGFVIMEDAEALAAINGLNGADMGGRALRVNEAREKPEGERRPPRQEY